MNKKIIIKLKGVLYYIDLRASMTRQSTNTISKLREPKKAAKNMFLFHLLIVI